MTKKLNWNARAVWRWAGWLAGWMLLWAGLVRAQHSHLNAGAIGSTAGNPLYFANGDLFVAESGYFLPLRPATNGVYAGYHHGGIALTALASTSNFGGPAFGHAAPGTRIEAVVETVEGPVGGEVGFWESDGEEDATALTFSVPVGERQGLQGFRLSELGGLPGVDPYGHIHGRKFTATLPGFYTVGIRLVDTGGNGPGGGPLHARSELFRIHLQAGVTVAEVRLQTGGIAVRFAAEAARQYWIERTDRLGDEADWRSVVGPVQGAGRLVWETVSFVGEAGFYRLRQQ
jgi:hypothetical protein